MATKSAPVSPEEGFAQTLDSFDYDLANIFLIGQHPAMYGINYIVVGRSRETGMWANWLGIDWTHHPNKADREMGYPVMNGRYMMTESEAFDDAVSRLKEEKRSRKWALPGKAKGPRASPNRAAADTRPRKGKAPAVPQTSRRSPSKGGRR